MSGVRVRIIFAVCDRSSGRMFVGREEAVVLLGVGVNEYLSDGAWQRHMQGILFTSIRKVEIVQQGPWSRAK
jgi:hypothetical protein